MKKSGFLSGEECLEGAITLAEDVSAALNALQQAFISTRFETKKPGCFIRELLLTFSLSSTTCNSAWAASAVLCAPCCATGTALLV